MLDKLVSGITASQYGGCPWPPYWTPDCVIVKYSKWQNLQSGLFLTASKQMQFPSIIAGTVPVTSWCPVVTSKWNKCLCRQILRPKTYQNLSEPAEVFTTNPYIKTFYLFYRLILLCDRDVLGCQHLFLSSVHHQHSNNNKHFTNNDKVEQNYIFQKKNRTVITINSLKWIGFRS